ncbi:MAG: dockerin type I domain-containing protein [Phycisphaerales bacterium]
MSHEEIEHNPAESEPRVPAALARDLQRVQGAPADVLGGVPGELDERIRLLARHRMTELGTARVHDGGRMVDREVRRRRLAAIRWISVSGVAAVLVLTGLLIMPRLNGPISPAGPSAAGRVTGAPNAKTGLAPGVPIRGDINGDGVVDILDAQRLAFLLHYTGPREDAGSSSRAGGTRPEWDINGDGVVSDADAISIAQQVVAVNRNGGAG